VVISIASLSDVFLVGNEWEEFLYFNFYIDFNFNGHAQ
jgi:hypothetical protein